MRLMPYLSGFMLGTGLLMAQTGQCPNLANFNGECQVDNCHRKVVLQQCTGPQTWQCCDAEGGGVVTCCGQVLYNAGSTPGVCQSGHNPPCQHGLVLVFSIFDSTEKSSRVDLALLDGCHESTRIKLDTGTKGRS